MNTMDKGIKYWLRWIGVIPIALLTGLLVDFPVHWVLYRTLSGGGNPFITPYPELPETILAPFFRAIVIVWIGSKVAPAHKFKAAVILASLWVFGASSTFILGLVGFYTDNVQLNLTSGGLPVIMGVIGVLVGLYLVKRNLSNEHTT